MNWIGKFGLFIAIIACFWAIDRVCRWMEARGLIAVGLPPFRCPCDHQGY
jgi:hypothetical protein